jgi:hypothetical protein
MMGQSTTLRTQPRWKLLVGLLCIALVVLSGTISATHTHGRDHSLHEDCGLCVAAHATAQQAIIAPLLTLTRVFIRIEPVRPIRRPSLVLAFDLFTRPPPVAASLS